VPWLTGFGLALAIFCLVCRLAQALRLARGYGIALGVFCALCSLPPIPTVNVSIVGFVYALSSNLSLSSLFLLLLAALHQIGGVRVLAAKDRLWLALALIVPGMTLYLSALGLLPVDVYRLGFSPFVFGCGMAATVALLLACSWRVGLFLCCSWAFAMLLHLIAPFGLSTNLWDQVLDFWLFCWAMVHCLLHLASGLRRRAGVGSD